MLTDWCTDEKILPKVYHALDGIDWKRDIIFIYGSKSHNPTPEVLAYLRNQHNMNEQRWHFNPVNRYTIDCSTALDAEIK